jgi:hypothetical protein
MRVGRSGQVTDVGSEPTGNRRSSNSRREAAAFVRWHEPDDARVSRPDLCPGRLACSDSMGRRVAPGFKVAILLNLEATDVA